MLNTIGTSNMQHKLQLIPGQSNPGETKSIEATTPELSPVVFWSPKSSTFSGSDSIVGEETHQVDDRV